MALEKNKKIIIASIVIVLVIVVAAAAILSSPGNAGNDSGKVKVVAAENFWGSLASQLGGDKIEMKSIVTDPNADPHDYESTTADAQAFAAADYIIINGAGYDAWAQDLISSGAKPDSKVLSVGNLVGVQEGQNPHLWYDVDYVNRAVQQMEKDLISLDPDNTEYYEQRYANLTDSLGEYQGLCAEIKENYGSMHIAATEDIADYLAASTGLDLISPPEFTEAVAEGNDPPASSVATFEDQLNHKDAKVLIYNEQTETPITENMKNLASQNGIPIVGITETMPVSGTFQDWMYSELSALKNALDHQAS